ncbi:MAG TPA: hypothetical protein EYN46_04395 [Candidatus Poseidoniales archaeon]|nr:MAG: hypothetical protein CXX80_08305 [Euryarchaeota archaeon]PXY76078.1 MAG: hypothetical protein CXX80_03455 [Euryarchaeota archaeon]HIA39520.1 hypothetical protein [Candidatus Poseidoniales archaeon]HIA90179.1 hypothetical protein [Candidatus Poseidoniales archaeon]HIO94574.1 hypothetical protein [Candidatus Poseidoniales archaeon]
MAKPYSSGHIGQVAANFTDMRISGQVKHDLVDLMVAELDRLVPQYEADTIAADAGRKTLGDVGRTRLNYNRTRELLIERISELESVGSSAVQMAIDDLETYLAGTIRRAESAAEKNRVGTIKPRHLAAAMAEISAPIKASGEGDDSELGGYSQAGVDSDESEAGIAEALGGGQVLTPQTLRQMAKQFAGMPVTNEALEELLLLYYDVVEETEYALRTGITAENPEPFVDHLSKLQDLMRLGWMRRMLKRSGEIALERGYKRVDIEQVVNLDPFA